MLPFITNRFNGCVLVTWGLNLILQFYRRRKHQVSPKDKYSVQIGPTEIVDELLSMW